MYLFHLLVAQGKEMNFVRATTFLLVLILFSGIDAAEVNNNYYRPTATNEQLNLPKCLGID